jgi:hypothetical protein
MLSVFCACQRTAEPLTESELSLTSTDKTTVVQDKTATDDADTVSLNVKMEEHSVRLVLSKDDLKKVQVSANNVKELKTWWDSLPEPLQSQIKAHEVEIKLVSNIRSSDKNAIEPGVTDSQIEKTGATLEKIIGESTDMSFTVNTTLLANNGNAPADEQSTNIILVKKVPTKLTQFTTEIPLSEKGISNQNIHSMQYWWSSLPEDLREKIQRREVIVDLTCVAIDKGVELRKNKKLGLLSDEYNVVMSDMLQDMIGYGTVANKKIPLGILKTQSVIESSNAIIQSDYIIRLQLRNAKTNAVGPL